MNYLKIYNLTDKEIDEIEKSLEERVVDTFLYESKKVCYILNIFKEIGVHNFFDIITTSPTLFLDTVYSIQKRIDDYGDNTKLAELINEDAHNLFLADLL